MYYLTEKIGRKVYSIAQWIPDNKDTCLAMAHDCFAMHGHIGNRVQEDTVANQKNWQGLKPNAPVYTTCVEDVKNWKHIDYAKHYKNHYNKSYEYFCEVQGHIARELWDSL